MNNLKKSLQNALESNDLEAVVSLAKEQRRALSILVRIAYDKETLAGWRAIKAVGLAAKALIKTDYEFLRDMVRKLLWSLSDESGGIGWSAPELIGEIVSADVRRFSDVVPLIAGVYDIEEDVFRPGVLYALLKVAEEAPELVKPYNDIILRALGDKNPLTRFYAIELVKSLKSVLDNDDLEKIRGLFKNLEQDRSEVWVYTDNGFMGVEIREAFKKIDLITS